MVRDNGLFKGDSEKFQKILQQYESRKRKLTDPITFTLLFDEHPILAKVLLNRGMALPSSLTHSFNTFHMMPRLDADTTPLEPVHSIANIFVS